jgi:hypothetical protein
MKMTLRTVAIATSAFACAALMSLSWSEQGGVSLSINKPRPIRGSLSGRVMPRGLPMSTRKVSLGTP